MVGTFRAYRPAMTPYWFTDAAVRPSVRRSRYLKDLHARLLAEGGATTHSALGATLRMVVERLEEDRVPYALLAQPGIGYVVKVPPPAVRDEEGYRLWLSSWGSSRATDGREEGWEE